MDKLENATGNYIP